MNKFITKFLIFVSPILAYFIFVYVADPYLYFQRRYSAIDPSIYDFYARRQNDPMVKLISFRKNPQKNILLGDSRMELVEIGQMAEVTGKPFSNLAFGGATLKEMLAAFWYTTRTVQLQSVYFGINFSRFQDVEVPDRVKPVLDVLKNPLLYFVSRDVFAPLFLQFSDAVRGGATGVAVSKDVLWQRQLISSDELFRHFQGHARRERELREVAEFCRRHEIQFGFVIFPTHQDLQNRIDNEFGLKVERLEFARILESIAQQLTWTAPKISSGIELASMTRFT